MPMSYHYNPLRSRDGIRLLQVSRSESYRRKLDFSLGQADINSRPRYVAVSYTWGRPSKSKAIYELGTARKLEVTQNSFSSLYSLCYKGPRTLWIDAVCLSQGDKKEKAQQLPRMSTICPNAVKTVLYLGERDWRWKWLFSYIEDAAVAALKIHHQPEFMVMGPLGDYGSHERGPSKRSSFRMSIL